MNYKIYTGLLTGAAIFGGCKEHIPVQKSSLPSVIVIYTVDLGTGDLSSFGTTKISTPNIDKLASESLRFTNVSVNSIHIST